MPIITRWASTSLALLLGVVEAAAQVVLEAGDAARAEPAGGTLISRLNCPSSVWKLGLAIASSASAFFSAGWPSSSTRLNSISMPVIGSSMSKSRLAQHPGEDVEAAAHLLAVARAVGAGELLEVDFLSHAGTLGRATACHEARSAPAGRPSGAREDRQVRSGIGSQTSGGIARGERSATQWAIE